VTMEGARGVLFNIVGGNDLTMTEVDEAAKIISTSADPDANIIFGATIDESMHDQIRITVVATGFDQTKQRLQQFVAPHYGSQKSVSEYNPFVVNSGTSSSNGSGLSTESAQEESQSEPDQTASAKPQQEEAEEDTWDIPAFLRQRN
ncbi:MAG TPA: cell division protein FtsZ, partial [Patescibacteria group bacterium]|nr:cell division protein FtsZ [Patescibacteria group bacterium]